jgi:gliding motility-associated-like protein
MSKLFTSIFLFFATGIAFSQNPIPNFTVSDNAICEGDCIEITNASSTNTQSWTWTFAGGTPSQFSGPNPGPVCFQNPGSFTITLTVQNTFDSVSTTQNVDVTATPSIAVTLADTLRDTLLFDPPGQPSDDVIFWKAIGDTAICMFDQAYMWVEGEPSSGTLQIYESGVIEDTIAYDLSISGIIGTGVDPNPNAPPDTLNGKILTVSPFYSTWYVFEYTVNGCKTRDSLYVDVPCFNDSVIVTLPNSFSPNGDGENDYFKVLTNVDVDNDFTNNKVGGAFKEGGAIVEVDFRIFDRYGHMVFRTINPHEGWDGTCNGKPVNPATYTYILSYRRIDGRSDELKGNVTLFR